MRTKRQFILLVATLWLSACASIPNSLVAAPRIELSNVQVVGLGFKGQTFLLSFNVSNPNAFPLPVTRVSYGVKLDGQRFASGETASEFTVPAGGASEFAISVDLNLLSTAPQLLSIVRDGTRREIGYELEGRLGVNVPLAPELRYQSEGTVRLDSSATSFLLR